MLDSEIRRINTNCVKFILVTDVKEQFFWVKTMEQYKGGEMGLLVHGDSLAEHMVSKQIVDLSSLLPLSISARGWICGLQGIKVTVTSRGHRNLLDIVDFGEAPTMLLPRLTNREILERAQAQLRQRKMVLKLLGLVDRDSFEMLSWLNDSPFEPWANSFDQMDLPSSYNTLYGSLVHKVTCAKALKVTNKPLDKQLAFPAKTVRWVSTDDEVLKMEPERMWRNELYDNKFVASVDKICFKDLSSYELPFDFPITAAERELQRAELDASMEDMAMDDDDISSIMSEYPVKEAYSFDISHSTMLDFQVEREEVLDAPTVQKLLENPDLKEAHYDMICENFDKHGIDFKGFLEDLFKIKKNDQGWLLNMITGFHNKHVENLKYLNSDQKQYLSKFLIDIVELYKGLHIRHVNSPKNTAQCATVHDLCDIVKDKVAEDNKAMNSIKKAKWLELNRAVASNKVGKLINLLDVLTLTNGYAANQVQTTGEMILMMMDKIVKDQPITGGLPISILNFVSTHDLINGTGVSIVHNKSLHVLNAKTQKKIDPMDFRQKNQHVVGLARPADSSKRAFKTALDLLPTPAKQKLAKGSSGSLMLSPIVASKKIKEPEPMNEE